MRFLLSTLPQKSVGIGPGISARYPWEDMVGREVGEDLWDLPQRGVGWEAGRVTTKGGVLQRWG